MDFGLACSWECLFVEISGLFTAAECLVVCSFHCVRTADLFIVAFRLIGRVVVAEDELESAYGSSLPLQQLSL